MANTDPMKLEAIRSHITGGTLIGVLMLSRLLIRNMTSHPDRASAGSAAVDRLAWLSHRLLYVAVFGQVASGLYLAWQTNLPSIVFGSQGNLPADFWVYPARAAHYGFSRLLMALIGLHLLGAGYHTLVLRDGLLRRMGFGRRRSAGREA